MLLGWMVLGALTSAAALNAVGIGVRARAPEGRNRSELAVVAGTAFYALLAGPVLFLGFLGRLTSLNLGLFSAALMAGLFALLARAGRRTPGGHLAECLGALGALAALPGEALAETARARSVAFVGLVFAGAMIAYALVVAVLIPATSWDGLMYHEPIVGFAIQNHGFAPVSLPPNDTVQATNGYPRVCEAIGMWLCIFTDSTLVEAPNVIAAPAMMLAAYGLARRFGDRATALGWASVLPLMPQAWAQLCQVYIDVQVAFFALAAIYLATRPRYRVRDAVLATVALALLMGSKFSALSMVPPIALVAYARLALRWLRARPVAVVGTAVGGSAALAAVAGAFLLRNWQAFSNPLWPVTYDNARFGIHWKGLRSLEAIVADAPLHEIVSAMYDPPGKGLRDVIDRGYGYGIAWVVVPVGLVALAIAVAAVAAQRLRWIDRRGLENLGWVLFPIALGLFTAPTLSGRNARYNLHLVAGLTVAITWLFAGRRWLRAREGVMAAAIALSILPLFWTDGYLWSWGMTDDPAAIFRRPFAHHQYIEAPTFDLLAKERSAELGAGDRVVFDEGIIFVGALWNFDFSNSVEFVPFQSEKDFLASVDRANAKWVAAGTSGAQNALLRSHRWQLVGKISSAGDERVYRRVS